MRHKRARNKERNKERLLKCLEEENGLIYRACQKAGLAYSTYLRYYNDDEVFRERADEIEGLEGDRVESKLMESIDEGDTQAIMFYLKTKGRNRGYGNMAVQQKEQKPALPVVATTTTTSSVKTQVEKYTARLTELLKQQGKYTVELTIQIEVTAREIVRLEKISEEVFSADYKPTLEQVSREGNVREIVNPKEQLYYKSLEAVQRCLRSLGMNTDSRQSIGDGGDGFSDFINAFKDD